MGLQCQFLCVFESVLVCLGEWVGMWVCLCVYVSMWVDFRI